MARGEALRLGWIALWRDYNIRVSLVELYDWDRHGNPYITTVFFLCYNRAEYLRKHQKMMSGHAGI